MGCAALASSLPRRGPRRIREPGQDFHPYMIVTCSVCRIRYLVDPRALGPSGRMVRCAQCSNTWHQAPPPDEAVPADGLPPPPIESPAPGPAPASLAPPPPVAPERHEERIRTPPVPLRPTRLSTRTSH